MCNRKKGLHALDFIFLPNKKKGYTKVQEIAKDNLTLRTEMTTTASSDKRTQHRHHTLPYHSLRVGEDSTNFCKHNTVQFNPTLEFHALFSDFRCLQIVTEQLKIKQPNPSAALMNHK